MGDYDDRRERARKAMRELQAWMLTYEVKMRDDNVFEVEGYKLTTSHDYNGKDGMYRACVSAVKPDCIWLDEE